MAATHSTLHIIHLVKKGYSTTVQGCARSRTIDPNLCPGFVLKLGPLTYQSSMQPLYHRSPQPHLHYRFLMPVIWRWWVWINVKQVIYPKPSG